MIAYLGLGSNTGDRAANLREALRRIESLGLKITRASSIYETEPVGFKDQTWFLNQVVEVDIASAKTKAIFEAAALLYALLEIEREMGRERTFTNGPRLIDIDLLLYGDEKISQAHFVVPHPRMHLRRFVLEPMCEIAPDALHPSLNKTCRQLLDELDDPSVAQVFDQSEK